jgi:hypothetical protein
MRRMKKVGQRQVFACGLVLVSVAAGIAWHCLRAILRTDTTPIVFSDERITFDRLNFGQSASTSLSFENVGTEKVAIRRIFASCKCTSASVDRDVVLPGEKGRLSVSLAGRPGMSSGYVGRVLVETSAEKCPQIVIPVFSREDSRLGRFELYRVNPPMVRMAAALPVLAVEFRTDWSAFREAPGARPAFAVGAGFIAANGEDNRTDGAEILLRW